MKHLAAAAIALGLARAASAQEDPFLKGFEEGLARARKEDKPLFVDFGHPW